MQIAQFATPLGDGTMRCDACLWRCPLRPDEAGRCHMRVGLTGEIGIRNHGLISGASVGPIEEHRLWHFLPDTIALAVGGWGYAFPVDQERGNYAQIPTDPNKQRILPPEKVAAFALKRLCRGVVWAYGEPAVSAEYVLEILRASRAASRYTALVTSGYLTLETLDALGPYLDGLSLDIRGFGDTAYARLADAPHWRNILELIARAQRHWHVHIEITTRMHHGVNDDTDELQALVTWIRSTLGDQTPWHVLPGDAGSETAAAVVRARRIGHAGGLHYIYGPEPNQPTQCPQCHTTLIAREKGLSRLVGLRDGECTSCGYKANIRTSIFKPKRPT